MTAPRTLPRARPRDGEPWQDFARRVADAYSARQIAAVVGKHPTTVLYAINPEFRRDKIRAMRRARAAMSDRERREESVARGFRAGKRRVAP